MKRILVFLVFLSALSFTAKAQLHNFQISDDGKIFWQVIFEDERSAETVVSSLIASGRFSGISEGARQVSLHMDPRPVDVTLLGYRRMSVPIYITTYEFSAQATIQFQEGRYRVTVMDIILVSDTGTPEPLETWAVSRRQMARNFTNTGAELYDKYLNEIFFLKDSPLDTDW